MSIAGWIIVIHIYPSTPAEYEERRPRLSPRVHLSSMTSNSQHSCKKVLHAQECGLGLAGYNSTPPKLHRERRANAHAPELQRRRLPRSLQDDSLHPMVNVNARRLWSVCKAYIYVHSNESKTRFSEKNIYILDPAPHRAEEPSKKERVDSIHQERLL